MNEPKDHNLGLIDHPIGSLVAINGTIVSSEGFNSFNSCVCFYIENNKNGNSDETNGQSFYGSTHKCWTDSSDVSYFSNPFQVVLNWKDITDWSQLRFILYIKVLSFDYQNFLTSESFGFLELPITRGRHCLTVNTYKPFVRNRTEMMRNYFMGCASVGHQMHNHSTQSNNYGIESESSGRVVLQFDVMTQTEKVGHHLLKKDKYRLSNPSVDSIKQNVLSVVLAFQRARRRMQTLKGQFDPSIFL